MRVLVAGAAGFIGSHLTQRLLEGGHAVIGVDNLITGTWRNLAPVLDHPRFEFHEHDVVEPLRVQGPLDWLLHFASAASPVKYQQHPVHTLRTNAEGTFHLLELARRMHAGFLLASTSEVYGDPKEHPQREEYWGHVNPIGPRSMYDEAKRYAEALSMSYHRTRRVPVRIIRIFNTYGPRMRPDDGRVVVNFIGQALEGRPLTVYGDGTQTRSFQYIDDLVEAVFRVLEVDYSGPINIGNPEEYTMVELAEMVRALTGTASTTVFEPLPRDDPKQRRPDIALARSLLRWKPRATLRQGLSATIEYFRNERARAAGAHLKPVRTNGSAPRARVHGHRRVHARGNGAAGPLLRATRSDGGSS